MKRWLPFLLAACLLAGAGSASGQGKRALTVEDVWAVKRPGAPTLSPDGRWAAVEVTAYDMKENTGASDIWLLSTDGKSQRRLTTHAARDSAPVWSPDGKWIAFLSRREGDEQNQVYLIAPEGGEARRLTKTSTGAASAKWFADSKHLAFLSWVWPDLKTDEEQALRLKERREAKVKAYIVDTTGFRYWDHWLTDGRVPHVLVVDVETGETRDVLAGTGLSLVRNDPSADHYDLAPDGSELALTADLTRDPGYMPNADVVAVSLRDGKWTNLTAENLAGDSGPRYSPDGKWLAYTRNAVPYAPDRDRVVLYDRRAGTRRVLAESWDRSAGALAWSADSQRLYFTAEDRARQPVWMVETGGGEPKVVAEGGTNSGLALSRDGRVLAFLRTTMGTPQGVFAAAADGSGARKIEALNDELVGQWDLGEVKEMTYPGWGGKPVQMWVIYPPGFDAKKKWPLLQIVHGGPHSAWMDQFHFRWNMHLFASRGYVVAAVNFHGSTGWGDVFADANTAQYGTKEFEDVEKGTDHLLAQGYIDRERLAAAGGSYGGYMVAWMNGHTARYKAYVCHAGVFDWVSQMASDVTRGRGRALGGFPWESPQKVREQSAHWYAKEFRTPTLVVHGEQDYRVPVTQGFEYYATLRMLGVPARLVYFPDENHWVLKPQNSRLWHGEFFGWVGKYVAPGPR